MVKCIEMRLCGEKGVWEGAEHASLQSPCVQGDGPVFTHAHTLGPREFQDVKSGAEPKVVKPYNQLEGGGGLIVEDEEHPLLR